MAISVDAKAKEMTLDVHADLFEFDLNAVADRLEKVSKMCSRNAQFSSTHVRVRKRFYQRIRAGIRGASCQY